MDRAIVRKLAGEAQDTFIQLRHAIDTFSEVLWTNQRTILDELVLNPIAKKKIERQLATLQDQIDSEIRWFQKVEEGNTAQQNFILMMARLKHTQNGLDAAILRLGKALEAQR